MKKNSDKYITFPLKGYYTVLQYICVKRLLYSLTVHLPAKVMYSLTVYVHLL